MKKIAIIGLGYVGLPLAIRFAESGVRVLGLDIDAEKVVRVNSGESYIKHIESSSIKSHVEKGLMEASSDFSRIKEVEAVLICVPTPLNKYREPNLDYVFNSGRAIAPYLKVDQGRVRKLIVLESTTYPGTTDTDLRNVLESQSGLVAGQDFHLAFSPEREDPGRKDFSVKTIPKVMGGYTDECLERCKELYLVALDNVFPVSSCRVAEATKLLENIYRSVNIALVNELKIVYDAMGINIWDVIEAAASKPFGYTPFYPGPGLGGHCIPIDPFYLTWKAREYNQNTRFIELAGEVNTNMPEFVIGKVTGALNNESLSVRGSRILMLGLAYKPDVDDDRESPSYVLMAGLEGLGASVSYNDPHVPEIRKTREHPQFAGRKSVGISDEYDCVLLTTHHEEYKGYDFSSFKSPIVDTRHCIMKKPKKYYHA